MSSKSRRTPSQRAKSDSFTLNQGETAEGHRQGRLEHLIHHELQSLIRDEATDPSLDGVTVLAVHLSPDGGHARIAYAVVASLDRENEVRLRSHGGLVRATSFLRARLAEQLNLKKLPKLSFTFVGVSSGGDPCLG